MSPGRRAGTAHPEQIYRTRRLPGSPPPDGVTKPPPRTAPPDACLTTHRLLLLALHRRRGATCAPHGPGVR